jgi:hypothetical protein
MLGGERDHHRQDRGDRLSRHPSSVGGVGWREVRTLLAENATTQHSAVDVAVNMYEGEPKDNDFLEEVNWNII